MRRYGRFPLKAAVVVLALFALVGYLAFMDVDLTDRAFSKVKDTVAGLGASLSGTANGEDGGLSFIFAQPDPTPTPVPADPVPMLVSAAYPIAEGYRPSDLVRMRDYCDESVVYIKGSEIEGQREAVDALMEMLRAAIAQGVGNWQISAGYRSVAYQQEVWDNQVYTYRQDGLSSSQAQTATAKYVAKPGGSEHHTGLAFDITVPGESFPLTEQSKWLAANCWDYGFIIRYTEEKIAITGINAEPWHVRYVGQPHAKLMQMNDLCLEEYLEALGMLPAAQGDPNA